jgi:hypothetical protein
MALFIELPNIYEMIPEGRCLTAARIVMTHQIETQSERGRYRRQCKEKAKIHYP